MRKMYCQLVVVAILALFSSILPAHADKKDKDHGKSWHEKHDSKKHDKRVWKEHKKDSDVVVIHTSDRTLIREYISKEYHSHCPRGLAKKHNGCLPPGQAKKIYRVGGVLPETVVIEQVPHDLLVRLQPVPAGYQYVVVDRDVLLISEASKKIIDAVTLLSAVGK